MPPKVVLGSQTFTTDGMVPTCNPHLPPLVAFNDMQENTAVQFRHHITAGEPPLLAIHDLQENTVAIFLLQPEHRRGALTSELRYEKDSEVTKLTKVGERIFE